MEFVNSMRKKGQLIMGIGHRVKSVKYTFGSYIYFFYYYINFSICILSSTYLDPYDHCTLQADDLLARLSCFVSTFLPYQSLMKAVKRDICLSIVTFEEQIFQVAVDHFSLPVLLCAS